GARGQLLDGPRGALDDVEPAREAEEDLLAVLGKLKVGEAADADALPFAPGLLLRGKVLLGTLEKLLGREQLARLSPRDIELEQRQLRHPRLRAQKEDGGTIGSRLWFRRPAEHEAARQGVPAQVGRFQR